jgi:cytochrome b561|tara:strand:+ start:7257 stop:7802 length:546 start_codon:yes stop_codon:yes gene_type:complete
VQIVNSDKKYGLIAIMLHWILAVSVIGLYILGLYMTDLTYYDALYRVLPAWHKAIGVAVLLAFVLRLGWRLINPVPQNPNHRVWEKRLAHYIHWSFYVLIVLMCVSGYLISTADGRALDVWGLFSIPALITGVDNLEDMAGNAHYWIANTLILMVLLHAGAAIKHQLIDKDNTLGRMLGKS